MRRLAAAIAVGLVALPAAVAFGLPEPGDPPSQHFNRCPKDMRPCTDPVVVAAGRTFAGPVEIIAFQSRFGLCLEIDERGGSGTGCGGDPPRDATVTPNGLGFSSGPPVQTSVEGFLDPSVSSVRARYFRDGRARKEDAIVAQVDGELLEAVHERRPFGVFFVAVRGCIRPQSFRLVAYDDLGRRLDRARLPRFGDLCGDGDSGEIVVPAPGRVAFQR
jgi:hypothetical protein